MNLERAIEILEDILFNVPTRRPPLESSALKLGIEALKREQLLRFEIPYDRDGPLPGETPSGNPLPRLAACIEAKNNKRGTK